MRDSLLANAVKCPRCTYSRVYSLREAFCTPIETEKGMKRIGHSVSALVSQHGEQPLNYYSILVSLEIYIHIHIYVNIFIYKNIQYIYINIYISTYIYAACQCEAVDQLYYT